MYQSIVQTVRVSMWGGRASSAMAHSATAVTTPTARGTFFSYTTGTKAASGGETTDGGHGPQWQWDPRYGPCFKGQSHDSHQHS